MGKYTNKETWELYYDLEDSLINVNFLFKHEPSCKLWKELAPVVEAKLPPFGGYMFWEWEPAEALVGIYINEYVRTRDKDKGMALYKLSKRMNPIMRIENVYKKKMAEYSKSQGRGSMLPTCWRGLLANDMASDGEVSAFLRELSPLEAIEEIQMAKSKNEQQQKIKAFLRQKIDELDLYDDYKYKTTRGMEGLIKLLMKTLDMGSHALRAQELAWNFDYEQRFGRKGAESDVAKGKRYYYNKFKGWLIKTGESNFFKNFGG